MDISLEDILAGRETALLTAAAWRYYLPALMTWCIRAPQWAGAAPPRHAYNALTYWAPKGPDTV